MTPMFQRAKTVHALDHAATVIGQRTYGVQKHQILKNTLKTGKIKLYEEIKNRLNLWNA
jgi:hypothetical protein